MPMRGELPNVAMRSSVRPEAAAKSGSRIIAVVSNRDLQAVGAFATIGFLMTVDAILYFPDFGELFAQLAVFP